MVKKREKPKKEKSHRRPNFSHRSLKCCLIMKVNIITNVSSLASIEILVHDCCQVKKNSKDFNNSNHLQLSVLAIQSKQVISKLVC